MNYSLPSWSFAIFLLLPLPVALAEGEYPIDLIKNQEWQIEVMPEKDDIYDTSYVFQVSRRGAHLDAVAFEIDPKTGEKTRSQDEYTGAFVKQYPPTDAEYLQLSHCWWKYEYIHEGFTCLNFRIPAKITQKPVKGDSYNSSSLLTGTYNDLEVIILKKDDKEIDCSVRGELYEGKKLYYTKASSEYGDLRTFACFETEADAQEAGYRLNFGEGGTPLATEAPEPPAPAEDTGRPASSPTPTKSEVPARDEAPHFAPTFSDIRATDDNYDAIGYVQHYQIVNGYPDKTFRSAIPINRAEFTKIVIGATVDRADIYGEDCFSDVKTEWPAKWVCTAQRKGVINGYPDGSFKPYQNISFAEAAKIIAAAFQYHVTPDTSLWYRPYVARLSDQKAIPASISGLFEEITRGEMAEMIYRLRGKVENKDSMEFRNGRLVTRTATPEAQSSGKGMADNEKTGSDREEPALPTPRTPPPNDLNLQSIALSYYWMSWDSDAENDGFKLTPYFKDSNGIQVYPTTKDWSATVKVYESENDYEKYGDFFEHKINQPSTLTFGGSEVLQEELLGYPYVRVPVEKLPDSSSDRYIVEATFTSPSYGAFSALTDLPDMR